MKKMEARDEGKGPPACKTTNRRRRNRTTGLSIPKFQSGRAIAKVPRNVSFADQMGYVGGSSGSASYGWDLGLFDI
jgi:hypothetical protein